jgi:ATP-dependent DNA ligase
VGRIANGGEKWTNAAAVEPKLVCQVAFVEWMDAWHLRHCVFVAVRDNKIPYRGDSRNLNSPNSTEKRF